ncbi:MAG: AraC family transcriptional regulator [Kaistella sp.]|nr:AraC family transcriptional regulator [Kaistella sp.]
MILYIKNMVCNRCKMVIRAELESLGLHPVAVELGEVEIADFPDTEEKMKIADHLQKLGFELIDDRKSRTIEKIKSLIIQLVHNDNSDLKFPLSTHISDELGQDYGTLSKLFSEVEGVTIEKYFIGQKVEKVKELLIYDEMTINEIAYKMNYSSVAYLSNQFKKVTGFSPSHYKSLKDKKRKQIDEL